VLVVDTLGFATTLGFVTLALLLAKVDEENEPPALLDGLL
jgi:hypothetical protein